MRRSGTLEQIVERLSVYLTGGLSRDQGVVLSKGLKTIGCQIYDSFGSKPRSYSDPTYGYRLLTGASGRRGTRRFSSGKKGPSTSGSSSSGQESAAAAAASNRINHVSYRSLGLTMLTGAGLWWYFDSIEKDRMAKAAHKGATQAKVAGTAAIGGDFELVESDTGKTFCRDDLKGKFSLLYFGFTHCPDVCPDELEKIASAVDMVNKEGSQGNIIPVFITLDPERDGAKEVSSYVKEFHPQMIGLTGSKDAIAQVTKAYRVYFTKAGINDMTGNEGKDDDYLIDHSIITYLLDPEGNFVTFYGKNYTDREMATSIVSIMQSWKPKPAQDK